MATQRLREVPPQAEAPGTAEQPRFLLAKESLELRKFVIVQACGVEEFGI